MKTIFAPRVEAVFGYAMLWVVLATVVFKTMQVYSGTRYIVLTGSIRCALGPALASRVHGWLNSSAFRVRLLLLWTGFKTVVIAGIIASSQEC